MGSRSIQGSEDHVIYMNKNYEVNEEHLNLMHQKLLDPPKLLTKEAGNPACSIFRVPKSFIDINGKSYQPQIVSIGPYHRGLSHLAMIEEHKWRYLGSMLSRLSSVGGSRPMSLEDLFTAVYPLERKARECYSEIIHLARDEFLEMMVLDGCFLIELFRKVGDVVHFESGDPILTMSWIMPNFYRDLIRLENQLPYFVLECLFDFTRMVGEEQDQDQESRTPTLSMLALNFFNYAMQRNEDIVKPYRDLKGRHLLDLVRSSYIQFDSGQPPDVPTPTHIIHCVSKLRHAGIKLRQGTEDSFLVVKFNRGVIEMPTIVIDDFMTAFLLNCVAYEQCQSACSKHFTAYATLLDCLVNNHVDVDYLCDNDIFENCYGTNAELARFVNSLGKEVAFDFERCYLSNLFNDVHLYYRNSWHVQWASFKYTYFNTPWSFISALAAFVLLLLTVAQTFYTIYGTYKK